MPFYYLWKSFVAGKGTQILDLYRISEQTQSESTRKGTGGESVSKMCRTRTLVPYSILLLIGVVVALGIPLPSWSSSSLQSYSREVSTTLSQASPEYSVDLMPFTFQAEIVALSTNDIEIGVVLERVGDGRSVTLENLTSILDFSLVLDIGPDESEEGSNCMLSFFRMSADAVVSATLLLWFDSHTAMAPPVPMAIFGVIFAILGLSGLLMFEQHCRNGQHGGEPLWRRREGVLSIVIPIIVAGALLAPYVNEVYVADISSAPRVLSMTGTYENVTLSTSEPLVTIDIFAPPPGAVDPSKTIYVTVEPSSSVAFQMVTLDGNTTWVESSATLGTWLAIQSSFDLQRTLEISRLNTDTEIGLYEVVTGMPPTFAPSQNLIPAMVALLLLAFGVIRIGWLRSRLSGVTAESPV